MSAPMTHRVFVYGTLKRGHYNNDLIQQHGGVFMGSTVTEQRFRMKSGNFPVIIGDPMGKTVFGEIYHVNDACLARLDRLESVGHMYDREIADVTEKGKPVKAFIYVARPDFYARFGGNDFDRVNKRGALDWSGLW